MEKHKMEFIKTCLINMKRLREFFMGLGIQLDLLRVTHFKRQKQSLKTQKHMK